MAKQSSHHTSPTTVVVSTAGASAAAASLSTSATTAVTNSSNHLLSASTGLQAMNQIDHHDMLNASTFDEVPVNGNIDSLISSSSSFIQVSFQSILLSFQF